jgi:hypothetical protein
MWSIIMMIDDLYVVICVGGPPGAPPGLPPMLQGMPGE